MKTYKLLRDMPTVKAGTTFREITREVDGSKILKEYKSSNKVSILVSEINDFDEWFEKIEPTDSIHWKPKEGDNYFYIVHSYNPLHNEVLVSTWIDDDYDKTHYLLGNIYRSYEEAEKARNRELAEVRLRRSSTFKPDFENDNGCWVVYYDPKKNSLEVQEVYCLEYGEIVRYETEEEALKSIKENERDWRIYFGIKEEK